MADEHSEATRAFNTSRVREFVSMGKFDWERAAKEDYIAKHGSVPYWVGYRHDDEADLEEKEVELRATLSQRAISVLRDFSELAPFEQTRRYEIFRWRLCDAFDDERAKVRSVDRLVKAIDEYESGALKLLHGLTPSEQERVKQVLGEGQADAGDAA